MKLWCGKCLSEEMGLIACDSSPEWCQCRGILESESLGAPLPHLFTGCFATCDTDCSQISTVQSALQYALIGWNVTFLFSPPGCLMFVVFSILLVDLEKDF